MIKTVKNILLIAIFFNLALSQKKVTIQDQEIDVQNNEAVIEVLGMVCSMCAYGIQEGFSAKLFIDKSKFTNGVEVDIDSTYVRIGLKSESKANPEEIMTVINDAGYDVRSLFIVQDDQLLEFKVDNIGILKSISES